MLRICYHGTDLEHATQIWRDGRFLDHTWFAKNLQDAIEFGGLHIFEVVFDNRSLKVTSS